MHTLHRGPLVARQMIHHSGKSGFLRRSSSSRRAIFDASLPSDLVEQLWHDPQALLKQGQTMRQTSLRRTVRIEWQSTPYVFKHYGPTWWHFVRQLPVQSWAFSAFDATHRVADAGIPTPRAVACIENRWALFRRDSYLVYPYVEGETLRSYLKHYGKPSNPLADRASQLRELWQRLKQLRVSLDDTHTGNFIISPAGKLWIIDVDKTRFHRLASRAARCQERGWAQLERSAAKCYA